VAINLPANQPSTYENFYGIYPASNAVDGHGQSCSVTNLETNPWWAVDLGIPLNITGVFFTNRNSFGKSAVGKLRPTARIITKIARKPSRKSPSFLRFQALTKITYLFINMDKITFYQ